ncbi:MAG: prepilin peptidase [Elusimicrobiota bacterium]
MKSILFLTYTVICIYTDLRYRKVFNIAVLFMLALSPAFNIAIYGTPGLLVYFQGLFIGLILLIFPYLLGIVGAGDVKFLAGAGCLIGWEITLLGTLYGAVLGGIFAFIRLIYTKRFKYFIITVKSLALRSATVKDTSSMDNRDNLPYVVFLGIGLILAYFLRF